MHTVLTPYCTKCNIAFEDQMQVKRTETVHIEVEEEVANEAPFDETQDTTSVDTEPMETFTTTTNTTDEPDWIKASYQNDCLPPELDDIREAYEPVITVVAPTPILEPLELFPGFQEKQVASSVAVDDRSKLPKRACYKCDVRNWEWDDVLDMPKCMNCG